MSRLVRHRRKVCGAGTLTLAAFFVAMLASCESSPTKPQEREVVLGGLFSLTGPWSTLGQTGKAAFELALEDVNRYLEGNAAGIRFVAAIEDTRLDPQVALEKARSLHARGVQLLIGPQSSAEVAHLKAFVDTNNVLMVSPSSTAGSLAIPDDNVFRFTPSDVLEGEAISAMLWEDGKRTVIPVWRDDAGNAGLEAATRTHFGARGGSVLQGVKYGAGEQEFSPVVAALRGQVEQALASQEAQRVAVYLAAFDEVVQLFTIAAADPVLGSVRWYGSDGVALSEALIGSPHAAEFAMRVGYPTPVFGRDEGAQDIWEPLSLRIQARTNLKPDGFALAVYDAVWVIARGYIASGATQEIEKLRLAFTTAAASGYGATGWTVLNEAGDRKYGDFHFWAVKLRDGAPEWTRVALYESRIGRLVR